jgi:hypothetical protein
LDGLPKNYDKTFVCDLVDGFYVDGRNGNNLKYVNHSCDPNVECVIYSDETNKPVVCMFSRKKIPGNTFLNWKYFDLKGRKNIDSFVCKCGICESRRMEEEVKKRQEETVWL